MKQQFTEEEIYKDRDSQITAIEKTFEDAQKSISQHYSKPRVTPVEVMPVFPDFKVSLSERWGQPPVPVHPVQTN